MRVFYYSPFFLPQSNAAAVRSYWNVKTLKDAGHSVDVLSSIETDDSEKLVFNPADNKQSFAKRLFFEVLAGIELFTTILFSQYDLYILSTPPFITISIAHLACRVRGKKYVLDVRDIYPDVYFAQKLISEQSLTGKMVIKFTKSMYQNSYGITSVTPGLVEKIKLLSLQSNRVNLLINGYDSDLFKPTKLKYEHFTVIFHGNMGKVQQLQTILNVAEKLKDQKDIEFIFIGEGPQSELVKKSQLSNVKYLGPKNYDEIPDLIAKAHVGISARRDDDIGSDAFPVKAFEYLGVGIPVILTPPSGVMTKMVKNGIYEFENSQIEQIVAKIFEIKNSNETADVPGDLSRQKISKQILNFCDFK